MAVISRASVKALYKQPDKQSVLKVFLGVD
jgi:hypothetical protein